MTMMDQFHKRAVVMVGKEQKVPGMYRNNPDQYDIYVFDKDDNIKWEVEELKEHYRSVIIVAEGNVREAR